MAQGRIGLVKGSVFDSINNKTLASATINILDGGDSSLVSFARSKENGSLKYPNLPLESIFW